MEFTVTIDDKQVRAFVKELLENLPGYSLSLYCTKWKYEKSEFHFVDDEDGKEYDLTLDKAVEGFEKYMKSDMWLRRHSQLGLLDSGAYDADDVDAIIQLAIFGELVYG
jgi:hypothetical protein